MKVETSLINALFGKPDYSHIARDSVVNLSLTAAEVASVFYAYDRGIDALDSEARASLEVVISKLKNQLWA